MSADRDRALAVNVGADQLGDVADGGRFGLHLAALCALGGALGLEGKALAASFRSLARPARALRWPSTADRPALALPRVVAAAMAASSCAICLSKSATLPATTSMRATISAFSTSTAETDAARSPTCAATN